MNTSIIISLLPLFFLLHELEEILMVRSWIEKNGTLMHKRFPKLKRVIQVMEQMTTRKFATIAFEELFIICICTFASIQTGNQTAWYCCLAAFGIHLIVHIIQSIV